MQLYIIRHAQSENNALWSQHGSDAGHKPDPELTEVGHEQAKHLGQHVGQPAPVAENGFDPQNRHGYQLTHLYCSLMVRAILTGQYVAEATGLPLVAWPEIHEWGGIYHHNLETDERVGLPGNNRAYLQSRFPELILPDTLGEEGWWNRPYEMEDERLLRAEQVWRSLLARHGGTDERVAIVTHGGFALTLLQALTYFPRFLDRDDLPQHVWFSKNNTSISRMNFRENRVAIGYFNDVRHLPTELIT